jgi:hypothetical protein
MPKAKTPRARVNAGNYSLEAREKSLEAREKSLEAREKREAKAPSEGFSGANA